MKSLLYALCVTAFAVAASMAVPAHADDAELFAKFADDDPNVAMLQFRLDDIGKRLARSGSASTDGPVTYCSQETERRRKSRAAEIARSLGGAATALKAAGFEPAGKLPPVVVISVRVGPGQGLVVTSKDGRKILLRTASAGAPGRRLPSPPEREDGPPSRGDVVKTAGNLRIALWERAAAAGGGDGGDTLETALARHLVGWSGLPGDVPPWLREGAVAWLESLVGGGGLSAHVCGESPDRAPALDQMFLPGKTPGPLLGNLVAFLARKPGRLPEGAKKVAGGMSTTGSTFEAAFGVTAADALSAVTKAAAAEAAANASASCEEGTIACTLCEGSGDVTMACPDCAGLGGIACPSCEGMGYCKAGCWGGKLVYQNGDTEKCGFCSGKGSVKCRACGDKGRVRCRSCSSGKVKWPCPACKDGRLPCPSGGTNEVLAELCGEAEGACVWCSSKKIKSSCAKCGGATYLGCGPCDGSLRLMCYECGGRGKIVMVYTDGTKASASKCGKCSGKGHLKCTECSKGKLACGTCGGKGTGTYDKGDCTLCAGTQTLPDIATTSEFLAAPLRMPTEEENEAVHEMLEEAQEFVFRCRNRKGVFCLREFRSRNAGKSSPAGKLDDETLFSNAYCIWALSSIGITKDDERMTGAWTRLREQAEFIASGGETTPRTQATALALRALLGGGEDPGSDLVKSLTKLLVKGQRRNGLWAEDLDSDEDGDEFQALFALETLWSAQRKGVKVPGSVFGKALRGAKRGFTSSGVAGMKDDWVTGTTVASNTALVILAQAGKLDEKAGAFDFDSMPEVQKGLAWLDRYFDLRAQPKFSNGARVPPGSDGGYMAYLFSIQRLAMLLNMPVLAGQRWHTTGSRYLAEIQFDDGSFEETSYGRLNGPVRCTANVMMFLARATVPITQHGK